MTLSDNIDTISTALDNIHDAIVAKGVTPTGNITTYADAIDDISSAVTQAKTVTPTTTTQVVTPDSNYDALSSVTVNGVTSAIDNNIQAENIKSGVSILGVTGTIPSAEKYDVTIGTLLGDVNTNGVLQAPQITGDFICNARSLGTSLQYKFYNTNITSFKMPLLESAGVSAFANCCEECDNLTEVDFSSLVTANSQSFNTAFSTTGVTSFSFPELTTIEGWRSFYNAFYLSKGATFNFPKLTRIGGSSSSSSDSAHFRNAFHQLKDTGGAYITNLSLTFPELTFIYCTGNNASDGTFAENNSIQKLYFPKLDTITYGSGAASYNQNSANNIFYNCPNLTEIHFALANQAAIEATSGYSTKWGAANATIYFDL